MKNIIILTLLLISSNLIFGQVNPKKCMTTKLVKEELKNNPDYLQAKNNTRELTNSDTTTITIPVVVHVIHRTTHPNIGSGTNISNAQIEDQLRILNEDYSKTNSEFPNPPRNTFVNYAGNPNLKFCLANTDPD